MTLSFHLSLEDLMVLYLNMQEFCNGAIYLPQLKGTGTHGH